MRGTLCQRKIDKKIGSGTEGRRFRIWPVMSGGVDGCENGDGGGGGSTCVWWRPAGSVARGGSVFRAVYVYVYVCVRVCMCVFVCLIPRHVAHIHDEHGVGRVGVSNVLAVSL